MAAPAFNEDSRVKIPAILHLTRLGYQYLSLKRGAQWDRDTNIFTDIFREGIARINPGMEQADISRLYTDIALMLQNEDLGRQFYEKLISGSGERLIDWDNFGNNSFHVVTELPCEKDEESFRPDITVLINGMPLSFIEVKKPNNQDGLEDEYRRMERRMQNRKLRKYINSIQFMVFSNNMEYVDGATHAVHGAYYASPSYERPVPNYFREEEAPDTDSLPSPPDDALENEILRDTNLVAIKNSPEFQENKKPGSPTNRILTSLYRKERLAFILRYAIAYVKKEDGPLQKHIMRYPQLFATQAIVQELDKGRKKGIIWHTQGSGKTALAYYNVRYLTAYYRRQGVVPKFYFIVDRIDLATQATKEFVARGLAVHTIDSREAFAEEIKSIKAVHNAEGRDEITVVNIQKFDEDPTKIANEDYAVNMQRVYFLDEVHRSYNPEGSFLANLKQSDPEAIKIGLTGTPLLGSDYNSKDLFGGYIHKYYYNSSIADGYTLRLIREEIETSYKMTLKEALESIEILRGDADRRLIYANPRFVRPMLDYILQNLQQARTTLADHSIGAMVICDSSEQAKAMYALFCEDHKGAEADITLNMAAEPRAPYGKTATMPPKKLKGALILHDVGTKTDREKWVTGFKKGALDILFVYNMLLTGFDAPRLKKLYLGRVIKAHNLLQALTRVNRTYQDHRYGYVVDFADISKEFEKTNQDYFRELQDELGDEMEHYSHLFKSREEISSEIEDIQEQLWKFDTVNAEVFRQQVDQINDRTEMRDIVKALQNARSLYNLIRLGQHDELLDRLDFAKLAQLMREAERRLAAINLMARLDSGTDTNNILNEALEDIIFAFTKISEEEMKLADELKDVLRRTRESLAGNFDPADPEFISLKEELERLFKNKNLSEVGREAMEANMKELNSIYERAKEKNRQNELLKAKYEQDEKYARLHKRLVEKYPLTDREYKLVEALKDLKTEIDDKVLRNAHMLNNESYVEKEVMALLVAQFKKKHNLQLDAQTAQKINTLIVKEYLNEYKGTAA
ncbi:type I restriction endonuclease subunit R [Roseivirga sp. BDSF3-8]|uniref:type I restriction endonuclease subunit R n=1 Tax=Roseivirga sp. BDSF3-8 TaxID=3241598 RepID=UPI00353204ED